MRRLLSFLAVLATMTTVAQHPTKMNVTMRSGDVITYQIADIDSVWFSGENTTPTPDDNQLYAIEVPATFATNDVLRVEADGRQVAEVCLEYINTVDARMVVVYPMGNDGHADLTRGFCAANGGSVVWNAESNTCAYTPGSLASPATLVYLKNGTFSLEAAGQTVSTSLVPDLIVDKRGDKENTYRTVKIGTQYWMAQNLDAVAYRNGQALPTYTSTQIDAWRANTSGAYHIYGDDSQFEGYYGVMYNQHAALNDNLAPDGWQVPSIDDYQALKTYLGTASGNKMKSSEVGNWNSYGQEGYEPTNLSGFSADASGCFMPIGSGMGGDDYLGTRVYFWTTTAGVDSSFQTEGGMYVGLTYSTKALFVSTNPRDQAYGHYIRCLRK